MKVMRENSGGLRGVEAVIDKDVSAARPGPAGYCCTAT